MSKCNKCLIFTIYSDIQDYAPTSDHDDQDCEDFYEDLENAFKEGHHGSARRLECKIEHRCLQRHVTAGKFGAGKTNTRFL